MESKTEQRNIELTIAQLNRDKTVILFSLQKKRSVIESDMNDMKEQTRKAILEEKKAKETIATIQEKIIFNKENMGIDVIKHQKNIKELIDKDKELSRKLGWINQKIFNSEKYKKELDKEIDALTTRVKEKDIYTKDIKIIKLDFIKNDKKKHELLSNILTLKSEYNYKVKRLNKEIEKAKQETAALIQEADKAENRGTQYNNEYERKIKDLDIYIKRAEKFYKGAFPKLNMRLK